MRIWFPGTDGDLTGWSRLAGAAHSRFHLAAVGFVTLLAQVVILREVLVASFGSELIYVLGLGLLMLGTAVGAAIGGRVAQASAPQVRLGLALFGVAVPLLAAIVRAQRMIWKATPGAYLQFGQQLAGMLLVLLPLGIAGGLLFTLTARRYVGESRTLAAAYAIESLGGLLGGTASTILIAIGVQNFAAALLCGLSAAVAALPWRSRAIGEKSSGRKRLNTITAAASLLIAAALPFSNRIDRRLTALNHPQLLDSVDTPYGRATVSGSAGQIAVFENDAFAYENQGTSAEEFVHVAALQVERPRSVLVLGGAIEGIALEVAKHHPARIVDLEIDRKLVGTARPFLPPASGAVKFAEPRRFLEKPQRYDLILSAMPEPDSGQASRFYTRQFFDICAGRLSPGGAMAFRLRSSENLWTPVLARRAASIVGALRSAFADVIVLPGPTNVVIASKGRLERDPGVLWNRFRERGIEARLVSAPYLDYIYTNDRLGELASLLERTSAPANSDARPGCYQYTMLLWLSRFFPAVAMASFPDIDTAFGRTAAALIAAVLIAAVMLARRSSSIRRMLLVAFAGFAGVVLESTLILAYQISEGVLYQDLGILLTMYMTGLAAGSWSMGRREACAANGIMLILSVAALACLTAWRLSLSAHSLASSALFLFAAGAMTGAVFAYASIRRVEDQVSAVAPLYTADLSGGVAGSLAASLFLIPVLGLPGSALLVGGIALAALALI